MADESWAAEQLAQLRARIRHYPPVSEQAGWAHEAVRAATAAYGEILVGNCPPSEELHEALRLLTDSVMSRANAAIARHGERVPPTAGGKIEYSTVPRGSVSNEPCSCPACVMRANRVDPLVNEHVVDPDGTRDQPHPYESLAEGVSDGFCRRCGRDSRHEIHAETPGWPWPYNPEATSALRDEAERGT